MRKLSFWTFFALTIVSFVPRACHAGEVEILRDSYGMPHIFGDSLEDVMYGFGYATAEDRLVQLYRMRAVLVGRRAEIHGGRVADDYQTRMQHGGSEMGKACIARLAPRLRRSLDAYVAGLNEYQKRPQARQRLGKRPVLPWTPEEIVLMTLNRMNPETPANKMRRLALRKWIVETYGANAEGMVEDLMWQTTQDSPPTILTPQLVRDLRESLQGTKTRGASLLPGKVPARNVSPTSLDKLLAQIQSLDTQEQELVNMGLIWGSSGFVLSGDHTESGNPLMVNHPSLGQRTPPALYEAHLVVGGELDVVGVGVPGLPFIVIGQNNHLAFGQTNGVGDQLDVYVETLHPEDPHKYRYQDQWLQMQQREEVILVHGAEPVARTVYLTVHGPVFLFDEKQHVAYSQKNTAYGDWRALDGVFEVMFATTVHEAGKAIAKQTRSQNHFAIDSEGHIAYWHSGKLPLRPQGIDERYPLSGDGKDEWEGILPFSERPQSIDPAWGFLGSANNKPSPDWNSCGSQPSLWGSLHTRMAGVNHWLVNAENVTLDSFEHDNRRIKFLSGMIYNEGASKQLLPYLFDAWDAEGPKENMLMSKAIDTLKQWDHANMKLDDLGDVTTGHVPAAQSIFKAWVNRCIKDTFLDEFEEFSMIASKRQYAFGNYNAETFYHALQGTTSRDYFDDIRTPQKESSKEVILKSLSQAVRTLANKIGNNEPAAWKMPLDQIQDKSGKISLPQYAGGHNSYRIAVELGSNTREVRSVMFPGNSERSDSPQYDDQLTLYTEFTTRKVPLTRGDIEKEIRSKMVLKIPSGN